jgi:signal transduction histidine kinase
MLIAFSAVMLIALSLMQYYLVRTTYEHKVAQFHTEIKEKLAKITNDYSDIDSTIFQKKDTLYKALATSYILDKKTRLTIKNELLKSEFKAELTRRLQKEFENEVPDLKIDFAIVLHKFIVFDNRKVADTIFAAQPAIANKMYGGLTSLDNAFLVRNYVGTTSGIVNQKTLNPDFKLLTEDALYVSVPNWEQIIWKRMALILIFAIVSILTLIILFIIAIKALIKQKKVSDIKTDFINNITHELKTPLTTLSVATKILQRSEIKENEHAFTSVVDTIDRQNSRLQHLIDQVMTSSLGYKEMELRKEKVTAHPFLNRIIADFKITCPNITIATYFKAPEATLVLDTFHLTTALLNILENAVKYGCTNITVNTSSENNLFNISIRDDGMGIAKNKQAFLFDKFYRVEQGNLHNTKGLGLGLYYVDQIVKAHQGTIQVVSEPGKGATFSLRLVTPN